MKSLTIMANGSAVLLAALLLVLPCGCGEQDSARVEEQTEAVTGESGTEREKKIPATDSASAATAMATGQKTDAGNIAWRSGDPVDGALETIAESARDLYGYSIGVVSTVPFSHATPACFVAHNPSRENYYTGYAGYEGPGIAEEIVRFTRPELVLGAGHPTWDNSGWSPESGYVSRSVYLDLADGTAGYVFVERTPGEDGMRLLEAALEGLDPDSDRLFGLFGGPGGNFEPPVPTGDGTARVVPATEENPTLAEATLAALRFLDGDEQGFFLMVEQGDIDWANHNNNYTWLIGTMWDLEETVLAILDYVDENPGMDWDNTLLIVTSDHSNSYMRLNPSVPLERGRLPEMLGEDPDHVYPGCEVSYGCVEHTNELVTLAAKGPAHVIESIRELAGTSPAPGYGILDNTHIHAVFRDALALERPVKHLILVIGDGMNLEHERAGSRYLYGDDAALAWHDPDVFSFRGYCTTWDVDTYDLFAEQADAPCYGEQSADPRIGYDPDRGGPVPLCGDPLYFLTAI